MYPDYLSLAMPLFPFPYNELTPISSFKFMHLQYLLEHIHRVSSERNTSTAAHTCSEGVST
jgi:hypothetical protein